MDNFRQKFSLRFTLKEKLSREHGIGLIAFMTQTVNFFQIVFPQNKLVCHDIM